MTRLQLGFGLTCLNLGLFACANASEPELLEISSQSAALTAAENSERALQGVIDAGDFLASSTSIARTLKALGGQGETCESTGAYCGNGMDCPPPETTCTSDEVSDADLEESRQELREHVADFVRELRERVLIEANLESETSTSATYRLGADVLCSEEDDDGAADPVGVTSDESADDCVERVTRLEPRLVLTSAHAGDIDVKLLLGAERHAPLSLSLYRQSLGVRVDLGESLALARELGDANQEIQTLSGLLELRLVENSERNYSLELNVLEALAAVVSSEGESVSASLGASSPAWSLQVDGDANRLTANLDVAALRVLGPLRVFAGLFERDASGDGGEGSGGEGSDGEGSDEGDRIGPQGQPGAGAFAPAPSPQPEPRTYRGMIELFLAGLSASVSYTADSDVLSFQNVGFGDSTSTLKHDGNTLFGLDLDATQGRRINVTVSPAGDGAQIVITPSFDLRLTFALHYIADQFDGIADALLDDTFRVWFGGDAAGLAVDDRQLRITAGTLHIDSQAHPSSNVDIEAGMCVAAEAEVEADASGDEEGAATVHGLFGVQAAVCE